MVDATLFGRPKKMGDTLQSGSTKLLRLTALLGRLYPLAIEVWLSVVLLLFVWIRIVGSQAAKSFIRFP